MTTTLLTICNDTVIDSIAYNKKYHLSVFNIRKGETIAEGSWSMDEYGILIKRLWEAYINSREKPKLLGQTLSDKGLAAETLHYIAPNVFFLPHCGPLDDSRECFLYWLKSESPRIRKRIGKNEFDYLNRELETILRMHLERKGS